VQHAGGQVAEEEAALTQLGGFGLEHGALFEEGRVAAGQGE